MPSMINDTGSHPFFCAVEQAVVARIRELGLTIEIGWDFERFVPALKSYGIVNPTYDPSRREIHPASFWIMLRAADTVIATTAFAYFDAGDLEGHIRAQSLWCDRPEDKRADIGTVHVRRQMVWEFRTTGIWRECPG